MRSSHCLGLHGFKITLVIKSLNIIHYQKRLFLDLAFMYRSIEYMSSLISET